MVHLYTPQLRPKLRWIVEINQKSSIFRVRNSRAGLRPIRTARTKIECMKILKVLLFTIMGVLGVASLHAQDIHFTLFNYSPLTMNPASTGAFEGTFRVGGIYRDQWTTLNRGMRTPSFYIDAPVIQGFGKNDWVGVGITMYQDNAGVGNLQTNSFQLSGSYHLALDKRGNSMLTLGVQGGQVQKRVRNADDILFADEISIGGGPLEESPDKRNLAESSDNNRPYLDLGSGLIFTQRLGNTGHFRLGFAMMHLTRPRYGIFNQASRQEFRYNAHAELRTDVSANAFIAPTAVFSKMGKAYEIVGQAWGGVYLNEARDLALRFGLGYRWGDSGQALAGIDYKNLRAAIGYDLNFSQLAPAINRQGGFEIGVAYIAKIYKQPTVKPTILCPQL